MKGKVFGKPYYYEFMPLRNHKDVFSWLLENFGEPTLVSEIKPDQRWYYDFVNGYVWLRDSEDYILYILMWR